MHELHLHPTLTQETFDEKWKNITKLLTTLAKFAGQSALQLFESEARKILTQAVDAKKEREFADEFNTIYGQLEEVHLLCMDTYMHTCMHACVQTVHTYVYACKYSYQALVRCLSWR